MYVCECVKCVCVCVCACVKCVCECVRYPSLTVAELNGRTVHWTVSKVVMHRIGTGEQVGDKMSKKHKKTG